MTPGVPPAGVLFDVDGTLVDTTYLHTVAWWESFRACGHDVPMASIHRSIGMGSDKLLDHLLGGERDRDRDAQLNAGHKKRYQELWPRLRPLPGAADLLRACAARGQKVGLASSADPDELDVLRRVIGADDVVDAATSKGDAEASKPEPDIVAAALRELRLEPAQVVFVGDSVWDVAACARLDIACIGLTCGGTSRGELAGAGAVAVYDDAADLLRCIAESPLTAMP
jgi:HAD superfamily hydrolase (TIGR01509 family)